MAFARFWVSSAVLFFLAESSSYVEIKVSDCATSEDNVDTLFLIVSNASIALSLACTILSANEISLPIIAVRINDNPKVAAPKPTDIARPANFEAIPAAVAEALNALNCVIKGFKLLVLPNCICCIYASFIAVI